MTCNLFEHWANYRDGTISRTAFIRRMAPVRREVERLLLRGAESGNASLVGMCRELHEHRDWLWTFVRCEGIEPTNNAGERACATRSSGASFPLARKAPPVAASWKQC